MRTKRILSILLSLVLVLGMLPGMSLTASAADTTSTITSPATTGTMTITLTIAAASVKTAPEANTLTYSGSAQTLTTTGEAGVGTLQYQLGESATTEPTGTWGTIVPQGTEAKDYYVWYRSRVNDDNISTAGCKTVTIAKASITNATVTLSNTSLVYNGSEQSVTVSSVKLGNTTLTADTDYEVTSGTTGTAKNTYTVTVTGKGNYKDTATAQWSIGLATPTIETIPTASAITYGQKLADSTLTGGVAKLGDTTVAGTFAWKNTETKPAVFDSNATEYDVVFTPTDADNYAAVECKVKLTVNKAAPTVTAPTAKTLTYTGSAQELVNAGSTEDGTLYYAVTTENKAPTDENLNDTSIPTGTDVGTYYVWYMVRGDKNHIDSEPACVKVTIEEEKKDEKEETDDKGEVDEKEETDKKDETGTSIETEVNIADGAPAVKVDNLNNELAVKLLTDEEKAEYEGGTPVQVYLDVKALDKASVPAIDLTAIEKKISDDGYTYGECLDLSLWKKVGDSTAVQIHDTNGNPISVTIPIPDTLKNVPAGYTRTFSIVRVHHGAMSVLGEGTGNSITIKTDEFSSYFIIFKDVKNATDDKKQDSPKVDAPKKDTAKAPATGDKINIGMIVMLMIDCVMAGVYLTLRRRMEK